MAQVEGLNLRGSRWHVRIIIPDALTGVYGKTRVNPSLGTSDRREATLLATLKRAEWLADFAAKLSERTAVPAPTITPQMGALLAEMVRAHVLADDDRVRGDLPLMAEMAHFRRELDRRALNPLAIPNWTPSEAREDDLTGLTPEEAGELAGLNAYLDGGAALALACGNLSAVLSLAQAQAAALGVTFDAKTHGAREALRLCLKAYRTAHHEVTRRDAGEVVDTPTIKPERVAAIAPRTLRDVFDRWKTSGDKARSKDSMAATDRALRQFESQHPSVSLEGITREMGDGYRTWLRTACKTSKTANGHLNALKTLLNYAADTLQWLPRQPWRSLNIKATTTNKRRAWTQAELTMLFSAPLHTAYAIPEVQRAGREAAYWVLLLGLFTGARLGEICQMMAGDVATVEGMSVLVLTDDGEGQSIKTAAGKRSVPIHSELIRLGFLAYAGRIQACGAGSLWPSLPLRPDKPSDYFGRGFKLHREALGMDGGATFHYFRHTVHPLMRRAGVGAATMDKVLGHATRGSLGDVVYDAIALEELRPAVEAIRFPFLNLPRVSPDAWA